MAKDAYYFLVPLILLLLVAAAFGWIVLSVVCLGLAAFVAYFFRNPEREIPEDPDSIVSPADGKILRVTEVGEGTLICIFLSVFDVHINRSPIDGTVTRQAYQPGRFLLAFDERASVENEQLQLTVSGEREISFSLIAGLVARRIVPWTKEGDKISRGDRIALIRFGSRVDIRIPKGCRLNVQEGDRVRGGESILAFWGE